MADQKTKPTALSVTEFIDGLADETVRDDCRSLIKIMKKVTGDSPKLWSGNIVGFGTYHYQYESGHEGYSCLTGFSPRKQNISLYVMPGFAEHAKLLETLGKFKAGKGCLYIKKLSDVDATALAELIAFSVDSLKKKYPQK
ncbi:DUF1801 domain-containing protein [Pseudochryseolinea flava]|uniref:DUF1801 domain-containing protein n=1 Tax=Pseudochryseolinea flava TaxID=2059302 RepID=A0A364Y996_9BACT|nr:DUF1801 domain-containing protein [Pseudochryseolinea flava]RAW02939.1 DUF1801 domain-containing protein [Pseudochryseolinea flava]